MVLLSCNLSWIVNKVICIFLGKVCLGVCFFYLNKVFIFKWVFGMLILVVFFRSYLINFGSLFGNVVLLEGGCVIIVSVIIVRVSSFVLIVCFWI